MRCCILALALALPCNLSAQTAPSSVAPAPVVAASAAIQASLHQSLLGDWVGLLEYRDYSEPPTSSKRVQLATCLFISSGTALTWHYIYDDGPNKVVQETDLVTFDPASSSYSSVDNGKPPQMFKVSGYDTLRNGRGTLILTGNGTDNDKPAETRITMTIGRNLLLVLQETRPAGSADPFMYRHIFRFTRATSPTATASR